MMSFSFSLGLMIPLFSRFCKDFRHFLKYLPMDYDKVQKKNTFCTKDFPLSAKCILASMPLFKTYVLR